MPANELWLQGEAPLEEMLEDPIVRLLMESDGLDKETVQSVVLAATARMREKPKWHRLAAG